MKQKTLDFLETHKSEQPSTFTEDAKWRQENEVWLKWKGAQLSFYLDYYPGYRDKSTMKVQRHESLGIYIFAKPKNQREKDYNERMTEKTEALRCRRYESN